MSKTLRAWRASFTRRWHTNPDLCDTLDYDCGHQGRVALLVLSLFPDASRTLLCHALTHDQGEAAIGDISWDAKRRHPDLAKTSAEVELREIREQGFDLPDLTEKEKRVLKLCDHLDAWLWMMRHARHLQKREDWQGQRAHMLAEAKWLAVQPEVLALLHAEEGRV
jgi:hypothetical protein